MKLRQLIQQLKEARLSILRMWKDSFINAFVVYLEFLVCQEISLAKAKFLATNLGFSEEEQTSINWVNRFKQRRWIKSKRLYGEGTTANFEAIDNWKETILTTIREQFSEENIQS